MRIQKKRIRSLDNYLGFISPETELYVITEKPSDFSAETGSQMIPSPCGPITKYNRDGKYIIHKEQEKEMRSIEQDYHIIDWHGNDHYGSCFHHRLCYPREYITPPLESIFIDEYHIRSSIVTKQDTERLLHIINMFLEMFGSCEIVDAAKNPINKPYTRHLQWQILPPGKYPWSKAKKFLDRTIANIPDNKRSRETIEKHHKHITQHEPEFMAIGEDGFYGYVVYGYPKKNLYIFESNQLDNATYIFNENWESCSKLTKRDLIQNKFYNNRLIHNSSWQQEIDNILKKEI